MADITMCFGENCPIKESCFRFIAEPEANDMQTYFVNAPGEMVDDEFSCSFLWKV